MIERAWRGDATDGTVLDPAHQTGADACQASTLLRQIIGVVNGQAERKIKIGPGERCARRSAHRVIGVVERNDGIKLLVARRIANLLTVPLANLERARELCTGIISSRLRQIPHDDFSFRARPDIT